MAKHKFIRWEFNPLMCATCRLFEYETSDHEPAVTPGEPTRSQSEGKRSQGESSEPKGGEACAECDSPEYVRKVIAAAIWAASEEPHGAFLYRHLHHLEKLLATSDSRARAAEEAESKLAQCADILNSWARELGNPQGGKATDAPAVADDLWATCSSKLFVAEAKNATLEAEAAALRKALREALEELYAELRSNYHSFEPDKEKWITENMARLSALPVVKEEK